MSSDDRVAEILTEWRIARQRGVAGSMEDVIRQHPELDAELREGFGVIDALQDLFAGEPEPVDLAPARIGPYEIVKELGRGGMGLVYLAEREGERFALKVLHPRLLERPGFFRRFQQEARAGQAIDSPHVVRTIDCDLLVVDGRPCHFLVMEYVEGRTLRALLNDLGTVPEALVREIAIQAAVGLRAIHASGTIHRDLKPENVLITDQHEVRVMDLGVARIIDESARLTREGEFAGSLFYAAPEQFGRGELTASADLYSLGVVLYELATGTNPFRADEAGAVMRAHLDLTPSPAQEIEPDLSPFLSAVLSVLLAKRPAERFKSTEQLHAVLTEAERSAWWRAQEPTRREGSRDLPRVPVRRETHLYGRDTDLDLLRSLWAQTCDGHGHTLLLEGEAGIGKTRLIDAFLQSTDLSGAHVLYGSFPPAGSANGVSEAIVAHLRTRSLSETLRPYLEPAAHLVEPFAAWLGHAAAPQTAPALRVDALHSALCLLMQGLAAEKPLLWFVDDLHFASADSRALTLSLARALAGHGVLLVVTFRPGLPEEDLAHFGRLPNVRRAALGRLGAREVIELLRDAFRSELLAEKLGGRIAYKSDGIPFFVFEMIRGLKEGQFITELPDGTYVETRVIEKIEVPSVVRDLIGARLAGLTKEERAILDVGAVQGFDFHADLVSSVLERRRIAVLQDLASVERRSGVVRSGGSGYRFDHHQIQEVVYEDLPPELRAEYHMLLAEALEERSGAKSKGADELDGAIAADLCTHFLRGARADRGVTYLDAALGHLDQRYESEKAIALIDDALAIADLVDGRPRIDLLLRKTKHLDVLGRRDEQRRALDEAIELSNSGSDSARASRAYADLGWLLAHVGQYAEALEALEHAVRHAVASGDRTLEGRAINTQGIVRLQQRADDEALALHERALALAQETGNRSGQASALGNLGVVLTRLRRYAEAREHFESQLQIVCETGDRRGEASALHGLGIVLDKSGQQAEAGAALEKCIGLSREFGLREIEGLALGSVGQQLAKSDGAYAALEYLQRATALAREVSSRWNEMLFGSVCGDALLDVGRYEEAQTLADSTLELAREIGDQRSEGIALEQLGQVSARLGQPRRAESPLEESIKLFEVVGYPVRGALSVWELARIAVGEDRDDDAERLHARAVETFRKTSAHGPAIEALGSLGQFLAARGRADEAARTLTDAVQIAREEGLPEHIALARARLADVVGPDLDAPLDECSEHEDRLPHDQRIELRYLLWKTTGDTAHLHAAHDLLLFLHDHAPEEYRDSMIENVPLLRDILAAWREHGGAGVATL